MTRLLLILALLIAAPFAPLAQDGGGTPPSAQDGGTAAPITSLASLPGNGPALLLFDANAGGPNFQSQWNVLTRNAANLGDLTIIPILSETSVPLPPSQGLKIATLNEVDAASARATFHCTGTSFCVVLLAKDGTPLQTTGRVTTGSLLQAVNPPPTQLDRAITQGQNSVYRSLISGPTANPFVLADLLDAGRPLLIFAQSADDSAFRAQWAMLTDHAPDLVGRNVVAIPIFAIGGPALPNPRGLPVKTLDEVNSAKARNDFSCNSAAFCVVLLDMADKTLLSATRPVAIEQIIAAIGPMQPTPTAPSRRRPN